MNDTRLSAAIALSLAVAALAQAPIASAEIDVIPVTGEELTTELSGVVTVVNQQQRMLTIKTDDGRFEVIHVPPQVQRLNEVKIGQKLVITETQAVLVDLVKGDEAGVIGTTSESFIERDASPKPAGVIVDTLTMYGRIEAIDTDKKTVTVRGSQEAIEFDVNDDALLSEVAVGDGVMATFIHSVRGEIKSR